MTNREKLMKKMEAMAPKRLAAFLSEMVSDELSDKICKQCMKANKGQCVMELRNLKNCPRRLSDWLLEETC